ncbi:MAG: hypothetical protein JXL85_00655 [Bacilli bacterium]|nr:hypothetical protein [Bacilli bacterium]
MLIAIIGENCVGKSTLANMINDHIECEVFSGKDYLRMDKNPINAENIFRRLLKDSVNGNNIIYVIAEKELIGLLPEGAFRIVLKCEINIIKERFKNRLKGNLPKPVEIMLEKKHGMYDDLPCDMLIESEKYDISELVKTIKNQDDYSD